MAMPMAHTLECPVFPLQFEEKIPVRLYPLYITSRASIASKRRSYVESSDTASGRLESQRKLSVTFRQQLGDNQGYYVKIKENNLRVYGMASVERQSDSLCIIANIQDGLISRQLQLAYPAFTNDFLFMDGFYRVTDQPSGKTAVWRAEVEAGTQARKHCERSELFLRYTASRAATGDASQ